MGRIAGRKPLPLRRETTSELMRAVARDFENREMESAVRERLWDGLPDVPGAGQRMKLVQNADGGMRAVHYGPYLTEPTTPRTPDKKRQVKREIRRLRGSLRRPRSQPPKYPELDAAMVSAVRAGESPARVVDAAILALRVVYPDFRPTQNRRAQFLDRSKKKRRQKPSD